MPAFPGQPVIFQAIDRLAMQIVSALNSLFGIQYSKDADFYIYEADQVTGATDALGTTYNQVIQVGQEGDFVATRLQANARINSNGIVIDLMGVQGTTGAGLPDAPFLLQITDTSTARQLSNIPVDASIAFSGYGGLPGVWPRPKLFNRNSNIQLRFTSLKVPTSAWTYRICLVGWRIYDANALNLTSPR